MKPIQNNSGVSRRDFLRTSALSAGAMGLTLNELAQAESFRNRKNVNCILLFLTGGPSHLDTWDMKPAAPSNVRGPFKPMATSVPGIEICEHFPEMAKRAQQYAIVRSVHHTSSPIHETGQQLMQTGRLSHDDLEHPHIGSVLSAVRGPKRMSVPPFVMLPKPIGNTGVNVGHGQTAGYLGEQYEPVLPEGERLSSAMKLTSESGQLRDQYGRNTFGRSCLRARRLVESGVQFVTVNMFETVFNEITWDCHADGGSLASNLDDYSDRLCPMFDHAYASLLKDLNERGMLDSTLVVAMGEFGRTPHMNSRGGRDHWPDCWSILMAGGGIQGGQVIGSSDKLGGEPRDRPVTPQEVAATIYSSLGIDSRLSMNYPDGQTQPLVDAAPIRELFA